jgi:uncharacterized protein
VSGAYVALIVKATRLCNLRCDYCNDWRAGHDQIMTFPVLAAMTERVLADPLHQTIEFIWHGGEPTLLGQAFFERAIYTQARLRRPGQTIVNSLQTNATRIDDDWARFLGSNRFSVSVSLDGPAVVHDRQRRDVAGRGSYDGVRRGIDILKRHGIPISVLMVVDRQTLDLGPDFVFDFCLDQGITSFGLLAAKPRNAPDAHPGESAQHYVTPGEMGAFLSRLFDRWLEHGDPTIRIREFSSLLKRLTGRPSATCVLAGNCFGSYFLVEPDGEIAHCDLFNGDPAYTFGNIVADSFAALRSGPAMHELRLRRQEAVDAMRACPNFAICNGWCPHEQYTASRHDIGHTPECCGLGGLIGHMRSRVAPVAAGRAAALLPAQ